MERKTSCEDKEPIAYEPGGQKSTEAFRNMAKAWFANSNPLPDRDRRPMDMPILETFPQVKQARMEEFMEYLAESEDRMVLEHSMANHSKNGYSNSNSNSNSEYSVVNPFKDLTTEEMRKESGSVGGGSRWGPRGDCVCEKEKEVVTRDPRKAPLAVGVCESEKIAGSCDPMEGSCREEFRPLVEACYPHFGILRESLTEAEANAYGASMGWDLCLYAMEAARKRGICQWPYVRGILRRLKQRGIRSLIEAEDYDARRKAAKGSDPWGREGISNPYKQPWGTTAPRTPKKRDLYETHGKTELTPLERQAVLSALAEFPD